MQREEKSQALLQKQVVKNGNKVMINKDLIAVSKGLVSD